MAKQNATLGSKKKKKKRKTIERKVSNFRGK